jgi:hypothetical protein
VRFQAQEQLRTVLLTEWKAAIVEALRDSISNVHYGENSDLTRKCITLIMEANPIGSNTQNTARNRFSATGTKRSSIYTTQACTDFDVCIKLTVSEQFRPPDYENDFGFALSRLVFSQIVFS